MKDVEKLRKLMDLPPLFPGYTTCLMCDKEFYSWCKRKNRRCPSCEKKLMQEPIEIEEVYWEELDTISIELEPDYYDYIVDRVDFLNNI